VICFAKHFAFRSTESKVMSNEQTDILQPFSRIYLYNIYVRSDEKKVLIATFVRYSYGNILLQPLTGSEWAIHDYFSQRIEKSESM
jgi:hypothetical protein